MKIFSNKLYFFFFSLLFCFTLFIGNVKALTNFNTHNLRGIDLYLQNKDLRSFRRKVLDNFIFPGEEYQKEKYIILIGTSIPNARDLDIYYMSSDFEQNIAYAYNYGSSALYFRNSNQGNFTFCSNFINIDTNGNITGVTQNNWSCQEANSWANIWGPSYNYYVIATNYQYFKYDVPTWDTDSFSIDNGEEYSFRQSNIPVNFSNGNKYNFEVDDYFSSPIPTIQSPYNTYHNGYTETTFIVDNYTLKSVSSGYNVEIINNTNGNTQFIAPLPDNPYQEITLTSYENTNYTIQIHDREYNIIQEYSINANINYSDTNFNVEITNVDNNTKEVFYKYIISDSTQNYTCYHSINNNEFIQDLDCTDTSTVYYNLTMPNNGNLAFKIEDSNGNIVYEYNQNFVFSVSETYISFQDNFENNYLNLNVLINRYQSNDIVEYSINNSSFIQANLLDYSTTQNIKNFYVNNLNNNDILIVRVKRNNEIITYATYKANYLKNNTSSDNNFNLNNFFDKLNINNINLNLRNYITQIGNIFINSKLGNLIILEFFIMVVCWVLKTIRK